MIETRGATIAIAGEAEPELLADLDQRRAQRTRARLAAEKLLDAENRRLIQWTIVGYPNEGWASAVFGEPDVERLWNAVITATRLDEPDPVAAWLRSHRSAPRARGVTRRTTLRLRSASSGPEFHLIVGLSDRHRWLTAAEETVDGVPHLVNVPTEEVYTTPDRRRTEGTVRSTFPLALGGTIVAVSSSGSRAGRSRRCARRRARRPCARRWRPTPAQLSPRRGGPRRRRLARPPQDRCRLPRHALRRERRLSHRLGAGIPSPWTAARR